MAILQFPFQFTPSKYATSDNVNMHVNWSYVHSSVCVRIDRMYVQMVGWTVCILDAETGREFSLLLSKNVHVIGVDLRHVSVS